jgi:hypothetical protein
VKALPEASLVLLNVQNFSGLRFSEGAEIIPSTWIEQEEKRAVQTLDASGPTLSTSAPVRFSTVDAFN